MSRKKPSKEKSKKPKARIRRGTVFSCDEEYGPICENALCDLCTARLVAALAPEIRRELRYGKWRAFTLVWDHHQFPYANLHSASLRKLGQAIKNALRRIGLSALPLIAAFDINLEEVFIGSGVRFWQIHLHGFIRVDGDEKVIKEALKFGFRPAKLSKWADIGDYKLIHAPVVFKSIRNRGGWLRYAMKEPSRIIDSHRTTFVNEKRKRVRHKMIGEDFEFLRDFLLSIRVRQRLFLQGYRFIEETGELVPSFGS